MHILQKYTTVQSLEFKKKYFMVTKKYSKNRNIIMI